MRQVNEAELVWAIKYQLNRMSAALRRDYASRHIDTRRVAEQLMAEEIARKALGRLEILSNAPAGHGDLFSSAAYGTGGGNVGLIDAVEDMEMMPRET